MQMYQVNLFGSDPLDTKNKDNDDCWTGRDFEDRDAAFAFYNNPFTDPTFAQFYERITMSILLTGPNNLQMCRKNPRYVEPDMRQENIECQREQARQAGMMGGIDAYNDAMEY